MNDMKPTLPHSYPALQMLFDCYVYELIQRHLGSNQDAFRQYLLSLGMTDDREEYKELREIALRTSMNSQPPRKAREYCLRVLREELKKEPRYSPGIPSLRTEPELDPSYPSLRTLFLAYVVQERAIEEEERNRLIDNLEKELINPPIVW